MALFSDHRQVHANLLPGRIHRYDLHPLLEHELRDHFVLDRALAHGTLPGNLGGYARMLDLMAASSGLISFGEHPKRVSRKIVVFLGSRKQQVGDVEILPLRTFLKELPN